LLSVRCIQTAIRHGNRSHKSRPHTNVRVVPRSKYSRSREGKTAFCTFEAGHLTSARKTMRVSASCRGESGDTRNWTPSSSPKPTIRSLQNLHRDCQGWEDVPHRALSRCQEPPALRSVQKGTTMCRRRIRTEPEAKATGVLLGRTNHASYHFGK